MGKAEEIIRQFETGANRDTAVGKLCYSKFLSPTVLKRFAEYMNKNRQLPDGTLRQGDNWQKGIPKDVYMESAYRHFHDWWTIHEGRVATDHTGKVVELEEALCAMMFNVMGYLFEEIDPKSASKRIEAESI